MIGLVQRILAKLRSLWFACVHAPRFGRCGRNVLLYAPFRVDGGEHIGLGDCTVMQRGAWLYCEPSEGQSGRLHVGSGCVFGYNNHITAVRDVVIEDHVLTANNVYISDNLHSYEDVGVPIMHQPVRFKNAVVIGEGSWIGENVCIIGASVGKNCVVGANSVVTHDIPDFSVAVGSPAVVIRYYDRSAGRWESKGVLRQGKG